MLPATCLRYMRSSIVPHVISLYTTTSRAWPAAKQFAASAAARTCGASGRHFPRHSSRARPKSALLKVCWGCHKRLLSMTHQCGMHGQHSDCPPAQGVQQAAQQAAENKT